MLLTACLLAAAAGVATYFRPWLGLAFLVVVNPFDLPLEMGLTVYTNELLLVGVLGGWLAHVGARSRWRTLSWPELLWAVPFLLALLLSALNASSPVPVVKQLLRWLEIVLTVWYIANSLKREREVKTVIGLLLVLGVVVSVIGIIQTLAGPEAGINAGRDLLTLYEHSTMRAYSTFGHSNQFAGYIILLIPVAFIQFVEARGAWLRLAVGIATLLMITALIFTFTRGAWLALGLVGAVLIYLNTPKKLLLIIALLVAVGATVFFLNQGPLEKAHRSVMQRLESLKNPGGEDSVNFRKVCMQTAMKMFAAHPLLGFGAGEFDRNIRRFFDERYYAWEAINKHIHNLYLQLLIETGVLGLAGFLLWMGYLLAVQIRAFLRMPYSIRRQLLSGLIAGSVAFLIHNNFDVLTIFARGLHFAVILGLSLAVLRLPEEPEEQPVPAAGEAVPPGLSAGQVPGAPPGR